MSKEEFKDYLRVVMELDEMPDKDKAKGVGHRMFEMEVKREHRRKLEAYEHVIEFSCPKCHSPKLDPAPCRCSMYHYRCPNCNTLFVLELYEKNPT